MQSIIKEYKEVTIQISNPQGNGTGFYIKEYDVIVTNEHVVRGNTEVVINGKLFPSMLSTVFYTDTVYDLALLEPPEGVELPAISLADDVPKTGDQILAIGHPFGFDFTATQGIVSKSKRLVNNTNYIQIDASINPGNSGGPLVNDNGEVVGINTFVHKSGEGLGFALPISYLKQAFQEFGDMPNHLSQRCPSCSNIVMEIEVPDGYCPHCAFQLVFPQAGAYQVHGLAAKVEEIINASGKDVRLTRRGANRWEITQGSAIIHIKYFEQNGYIVGDAHLARLPKSNIGSLYEYLLKENERLEGAYFSLSNQDIILSCIIQEKYLNKETATKMFKYLMQKADDYDDILIDKFGAIKKGVEV